MNPELTINEELFREVQAAILRWPQAFNMDFSHGNNGRVKFDPKTMEAPTCGSACCLFGWGVILGDQTPLDTPKYIPVYYRGKQLFGLTERQANRLYKWRGEKYYLAD